MIHVSEGRPFLSVVMSVYNAGNYVGTAISSILGQTYSHFEFIIVLDCGSTDNSREVVEEFARRDNRIQVLCLPHCGASEALNAGIAIAKGDYIAQFEPDDISLPHRFAVQLAWMKEFKVDVCGACVKCFDNSNRILWFPEEHSAIQAELMFRSAIHPTTVIARAAVLKDNPYKEGVIFQDYELWTRLAPKYKLGNVQQFLVQYRNHPQQTSQVKSQRVREDLRTYRQHYFNTIFHEATAEDYQVLADVGDGTPHTSLQQLRLAGEWLVRLADSSDRFLRERMANKWLAASMRSAGLGLSCYHLYQEIVPKFNLPKAESVPMLWCLCAARIGSESRMARLLRKMKHTILEPHNATT